MLKWHLSRLSDLNRRPTRGVYPPINEDAFYLYLLSHPPDLNWRPTRYECVALPTELGWHRQWQSIIEVLYVHWRKCVALPTELRRHTWWRAPYNFTLQKFYLINEKGWKYNSSHNHNTLLTTSRSTAENILKVSKKFDKNQLWVYIHNRDNKLKF